MIKDVFFHFGASPDGPSLNIPGAPLTIFVGPNNSGKSQALIEIARICREGNNSVNDMIIKSIAYESFSESEAIDTIERCTLPKTRSYSPAIGNIIVGKRNERIEVSRSDLLQALLNPNQNKWSLSNGYLRYNTLILNGESRLSHINDTLAGDQQEPAQSSLQVLFRDDSKRKQVRNILHDAFNTYFTIDPTNHGSLRIRFADRAPKSDIEERGWHAEAVDYHSSAQSIHELSDGVRAFTGIILEVFAGDPAVLLIDEPEAFLHPALSFKLGMQIAKGAGQEGKRIFVSTHSPNFVMGAIQSGVKINIVRLTYRNRLATARSLSSADLYKMMRSPMLRSINALSGLFYEFVIVTEADPDRAFYQEINHRLAEHDPLRAIPNCLFLNAQNKQTVGLIVKPLRCLGIPVVGIVDIDVVKDGGQTWTNLVQAIHLPNLEHNSLGQLRASIKLALEATGRDMKRDGGIDLLPKEHKESANNFFGSLSKYGLFVVKRGELESWLKHLNVKGKGPYWLSQIFESLGEDPQSSEYVKPSEGDVWDFLADIRSWLLDGARAGIPD